MSGRRTLKIRLNVPRVVSGPAYQRDGIDGLQVNFFFNQIKDAAGSHSGPMCSSQECEGKPAVKYCDKCGYVCADCERDHKTVSILKKHKLVPVAEAKALAKSQQFAACAKHPEELIKLYCETCKVAVCSHCCLSLHSQHKWVELTTKADKSKVELQNVLQLVQNVLKFVKGTELIMQKEVAQIDKDGAEIKQQVHRALMALEVSINTDVDEACQQACKQLSTESASLRETQGILESIELCGEKRLQHGNPADYMMTVPVLVKQLHDNNPQKMTYLMKYVDLTGVKQEIENIKVNMMLLPNNYRKTSR